MSPSHIISIVRHPFMAALAMTLAGPFMLIDVNDNCDTSGIYPVPTLVCTNNSCSGSCPQNLQVTTNNNHSGVACGCNGIGGQVTCCSVAYVASIHDYETFGDCLATGCPHASECKLGTYYDHKDPPHPVLKVGVCKP